MQTKARALVVMSRSSFEAHFDADRLRRLAGLVTLDDPCWTDELDSARSRERLARAEVLLTSWGAPALTPQRVAAAPGCGPCCTARAACAISSARRCGGAGSG